MTLESRYAAEILKWQRLEIERIGRLIRLGGLQAGDLADDGAMSIFAHRERLRNDLLNLMTRASNFGRGQVRHELKRQGVEDAR